MKQLGIACCILIFSACTTTYITSTWKNSDLEHQELKKIMVVSIMNRDDRSVFQRMENHIAGDLKDLGYDAFSAYEKYGPKSFEGLTEKDAIERLSKDNVDAVLTVVMLNKEKERHYVPARVVYSPYYTYHDRWYTYYTSIYLRIGSSGYYDYSTNYFWESNLYDARSNKLIYSIQTKTFDPISDEAMAHEYGRKIVAELAANSVFKATVAKKPM